MRVILWISAFTVALLLGGAPVIAQSNPDYIGVGNWTGPLRIRFDDVAVAGRPVHARLPGDGCYQGDAPHIEPERTVITRNGNAITLDLYSRSLLCFSAGDPTGVWIHDQPLGTFEAGEYVVTARFRYHDSGNGEPFATLTAPLSVVGGTDAVTLDARSPWSLGLMIALLAAIGLVARRQRLR